MEDHAPAGVLRLVATPIGHLDDLSPRARRALADADLIACEDTRRTGRLLAHLGLKKRMVSMHDHNERQRMPMLLEALEGGNDVVVVSDAGTPLLADPGFPLVREAAARGLRVEPVPGPSAILAALAASALPPYPFTFGGFPPPKVKKRRAFYRQFGDLGHTCVFFESPHRLMTSLADARHELADRPAAVCRELTKVHEEILRGDLGELIAELSARQSLKGEFVLVIGAAPKTK
ncbi:MAG: 16S rRNA (cytidine(1402)-2'-O)-methyltransferase [Acidobacteriota bacterium]